MSFGTITSDKVIETDFADPAFTYIIKVQTGQQICFGSTVHRNTAPIGKGLSPFQRRKAPEWFRHGPGTYNADKYTSALYPILNKVRSTRGVGSLASKEKRFKHKHGFRTPSPGRYNVLPKHDTKQSHAPFGVQSVTQRPDTNNNPGPATYDIRKVKKCRRTRFMDNFGHPSMIYAVETLCVPEPVDTCHKCKELCKGDYWHIDYYVFLCHLCWEEEKHMPEIYDKKQLREFKKIRNCSFMHNHEGTEAAVLTLPPNMIKKKLYLENYLELYINC